MNLAHVRLNHFLTIRLTRLPCRVNLRPLVIFIGVDFSRPLWAAFSFASINHRVWHASDNGASTLRRRALLCWAPRPLQTTPLGGQAGRFFSGHQKERAPLADKGALKVPAPWGQIGRRYGPLTVIRPPASVRNPTHD